MLENYTFLPFSMFLAVFWIFTYKKVPETKNKTFDEIATLFKIQNKQKWVHFILSYFPNIELFCLGERLNANDVWQEPGELRQQHRSDQHRLWPAPSALSRWEEAWQPPDEWVLQLYEYDCES